MAKSKISETKKTTHKLATEGTIRIIDNLITIEVENEGVKNLHQLIKNFDGEFVKFAIQTEEQEDVEE